MFDSQTTWEVEIGALCIPFKQLDNFQGDEGAFESQGQIKEGTITLCLMYSLVMSLEI